MRALGFVLFFCAIGNASAVTAAATSRSPDDADKFPAVTGPAQPGVPGHVVVPGSSIERPGDIGKRSHTNVQIFVPGRRDDGTGDGPPQNHPDRH